MPKKRKPNGKTEIKPFPKEVQEHIKSYEEDVDHSGQEEGDCDWADTPSPVGGADLWWDPESGEPRCG